MRARGGWSSWTRSSGLARMLRRDQDRRRLWSHRQQIGLPRSTLMRHELQVSVAESSPRASIVLTGETVGRTNESGVAVISGLALWPQGTRPASLLQDLWVKLRVTCMTCGGTKGVSSPVLESSKIYVDTSKAIGVYGDAVAAGSALARWQSDKTFAIGRQSHSSPLVLPGRPAQMCLQLFDRPFADVLLIAQHSPGLVRLGPPSIRVSPYTWPQPACWQFAGAARQAQEVSGTPQNVTFELRSADATYNNKTGLTWGGMAASDGSVSVIVLHARSALRRTRLQHLLRGAAPRQLDVVEARQLEQARWIEVRGGPLQGLARVLLLPATTAQARPAEPPVVALQWVQGTMDTALQWRAAALMTELLPPQTHVTLEIRSVAPLSVTVHITGKCVDRDAGGALVATLNKSLSMIRQGLHTPPQEEEKDDTQMPAWQQLDLVLDWEQLAPASAGLLQHHVVCQFRATADNSTQPLRFVPKASVDLIICKSRVGGRWPCCAAAQWLPAFSRLCGTGTFA